MMQEDRTVDYFMERFFKRYELTETASEMCVERIYRALVGDTISRLTLKISYKKGTLRLRLASAALRQEITFRKERLRQAINDQLGSEEVQKIVLQ
jgi:hypothetical protein